MSLKFKLGFVILSIFSLLMLGLDIQASEDVPEEPIDIYGRALMDNQLSPGAWRLSSPDFYDLVNSDSLNSSGIFLPYVIYPTNNWSTLVGIGDFNQDALNDVAVGCDPLHIFSQNANGTLDPPITYTIGVGCHSLIVGDFNHDLLDDIALASPNPINLLSVLLQQPGGGLAAPVQYSTQDRPDALAVGDLNFDGLDDIVVSHWSDPNIGVFIQQADGAFSSQVLYFAPQAGWDDIDTGDLNHDERVDVAKSNGQIVGTSLSVYLQNMEGSLDDLITYTLPTSIYPKGVAIGDVSGDGLDDIVATHGGNRPNARVSVLAQTISGTLELSSSYTAYDIPGPVEIADVNNDGLLDVVVLHNGWSSMSVYLQGTNGLLLPYERYYVPYSNNFYYPQALDVGDINNDGWTDVVIGNYDHELVILYNSGTFVPTTTPTPSPPPTITPTPSPSPTTTPTATFAVQPTVTATSTYQATLTATLTAQPSPTVTPTSQLTPTATLIVQFTPSVTSTPQPTLTATPTSQFTLVTTATAYPTLTTTPSFTPGATTTITPTPVVTFSPTPDWVRTTPSATSYPTLTPSHTATSPMTSEPTLTPTSSPTFTFTPTPTTGQQPVPPYSLYIPLVKNGS